jgi:co-chaperonin GroES (HSP10)
MAKVKIPKNYFLVKVEKPYEDTIELKNGKRIILNYTFDPLKHARQYGIVYQVPEWLPKGLEFDVKIGDKVYFHHMITASTGNVSVDKKFANASSQDLISDNKVRWLDEENLYSVHWDFIYARVRGEDIKMLHHWNFVEQKVQDEEEIKSETGIFLKPGVEDIELYGYIRHLSDWMKEQGIKEGDEVVFSVNSEYDMKIEGEVLLRMRNEDILATVEDGKRKQ